MGERTAADLALGLDIWRALGHGDVAAYEAEVERDGFAEVWARLWYEVKTLNAMFGGVA